MPACILQRTGERQFKKQEPIKGEGDLVSALEKRNR